MKIADLFVSLGIKGADKTGKEVSKVGTAMKDARNMSIEAKAAIVGAFYAAQQMFSKSGAEANKLNRFSSVMDTTVETLQRYQYAARQVGATNEEVEASFRGIQKTMYEITQGNVNAPVWGRLQQAIGEISEKDREKFRTNPEELIARISLNAGKWKSKAQYFADMSALGVSEGMAMAMQKNAFRPEVLARAPVYSSGEVKAQAQNSIAMANLENKIEMAFGRFNSKHGAEIIKGLDMIITSLIKLADVAMKAAKDLKAFEHINTVIKSMTGWIESLTWFSEEFSKAAKGQDSDLRAFQTFITWFVDTIKELSKTLEGPAKLLEAAGYGAEAAPNGAEEKSRARKLLDAYTGYTLPGIIQKKILSGAVEAFSKDAQNRFQALKDRTGGDTTVNFQQTNNFAPGTDTKRAGDDLSRGYRKQWKGSPVQAFGD